MKKSHTQGFVTASMAFTVLLFLCGCSKATDPTPIVDPPVVVSPPSGVIQYFTLIDTLVPFNTGSTVKWLVNGTNNQTVVTFNGVIVSFNGVLDTGPLKQNTVFTLAINNGQQSSITLKVSDSITTLLWSNGKAWALVRSEVYIVPANQAQYTWVDTTKSIDSSILDQRIYFNYNGGSTIIQSTPSKYVSPGDAGKFVVNSSQTQFTWQGILFTITTLDDKNLVVLFDALQPNGTRVRTRYTYKIT
jgi:hypothetical protein